MYATPNAKDFEPGPGAVVWTNDFAYVIPASPSGRHPIGYPHAAGTSVLLRVSHQIAILFLAVMRAKK
jgi:hypothetical protein